MSDQEGKSSFDLGKLGEIASSKRVTRRSVLQGAAAAGALAALGPFASACGSSSSGPSASPSAAAAAPKQGGHIRSAIGGGTTKDILDPHRTYYDSGSKTVEVWDSLVGWDQEHKLVMKLAESYEVNADATVHTYRLKPDLTFHNGQSVTADDVVYSFRRIIDPAMAALGSGSLVALKPSGIKKIDDLTVSFTLTAPDAIFVEAVAYYANAVVPVGFKTPNGAEGAIGTGPWKPISYDPGLQTEFVANRDYWGEGPYADKLTMIEFADPAPQLNALLGGTVDHLANLASSQMGIVKSTPGLKVLEAKGGGWNPFTMRIDKKPFDDVRVRQAFRLIIDRQQVIDQGKGGFGRVANDMYAPYDPGYPTDLPQRVQDLEQAKSLLKQAGYNNDLSVVLNCTTSTMLDDPDAAQVFAEQLNGAGVTCKVNKVDPDVYWNVGNYRSYPFAMSNWGTSNYLYLTRQVLFPTGPYYETHWVDAEWEKLVLEAFKTVDDAKRNELVRQAETIEYERGGHINYQFGSMLDAYTDKLGGLVPDNFGQSGATYQRYNLFYFV
jgi:peptide/nickel transport system substrate-binding protein